MDGLTGFPEAINNIYPQTEVQLCIIHQIRNSIKLVGDLIRTDDERIESLFNILPDADLFKSLPDMGPCMGPRILAALGDNRNRFYSAEEIQNCTGVGNVPSSSDRRSWNGQLKRLTHHTGPDFIIMDSEKRGNLINPPTGLWPLNG